MSSTVMAASAYVPLFQDGRLQWAHQSEQLGTGMPLHQAMPAIPDSHRVLVLYGDVPLLRAETLRELIGRSGPRGLGLLTARLANPSGYGRIFRDQRGKARASSRSPMQARAERRIREINTGVVTAGARWLKGWLSALKPRNAQGEYYLTDIMALAVKQKCASPP